MSGSIAAGLQNTEPSFPPKVMDDIIQLLRHVLGHTATLNGEWVGERVRRRRERRGNWFTWR